MKDCPECGEQVADDAVHCGHCGAKVEEERSEKQTMFGVGTVDADSLKSAVDEANQDSGSEETTEEPEAPDASDSDQEGSGGFRLPTPGEAGAGSGDDQQDDSTPVGMSTQEEDSESSLDASGLPEPSDVGDGRLSAPESDAEREDPAAETVAEPDSASEPGDDAMLGETLSMESPPEVQSGGEDELADEETQDEEAADLPETEPTDMSPPASNEAESPGVSVGDDEEVPGELAPTRREVETVDDEPDQVDQQSETAEPEVDSTDAAASKEVSVDETDGEDVAVEPESPETSAGSRFEQADETAPPQEVDSDSDDGRVSTKTLLIIAAVLFGFCMVACGGFLGMWAAGYV